MRNFDWNEPTPAAATAVIDREPAPAPEPQPVAPDIPEPEVIPDAPDEPLPRHEVGPVTLVHGEALVALREMEDDSVDAVVTDPPYGLSKAPDMAEVLTHWLNGDDYEHRGGGFMGKQWDSFVPGPSVWREVYRVLKPGGFALVFAGARTQDLMGLSLRLAGFEMRDVLSWMYGQGFPKSMNVGKAIDKAAGAERQVVGYDESKARPNKEAFAKVPTGTGARAEVGATPGVQDNGATVTAPATPEAAQWEGWGTALKPAYEPILMVRKPLTKPSQKTGKPIKATVVETVLEHGTGAINIDATRVGYQGEADKASATPQGRTTSKEVSAIGAEPDAARSLDRVEFERPEQKGRWPANVVLSHTSECEQVGTRKVKTGTAGPKSGGFSGGLYGGHTGTDEIGGTHADADGTEEVPAWNCAEGCPVAMLDEHSGDRPGMRDQRNVAPKPGKFFTDLKESGTGSDVRAGYNDSGGASRFFYCAKATKAERGAGLDESNPHPTVKPLDVMRWLVRMITQPSGVVLDPYGGSGTTGMAAISEGMRATLIEMEPSTEEADDYIAIAKARIVHHMEAGDE